MKKIFLNNVVVRDNNLSDYEMAIYIALRSLYDTQRDLQYITYNSIVFELYSHLQISRRSMNHIKVALNTFIER